jgi:hypothetical protein
VRSKFRLVLVAVVLLLAALVAPGTASAGSYTVRQCDYTVGNGHSDFGWQAAGSPGIALYNGSGCSEFGLAARNGAVGSEQRYPSGGYGGWFAYAPIGTVITRFSGAFGTIVGCCVNGMAPYAEAFGTTAKAYLFQGDLGNDSWYAPSGLRGPQGRSWQASTSGFDARSVGFYLRCGPGFSCYQNPTGDFRLRGRSFDFTLRDDVPPSLGAPGGTLLAGGWLGGNRTLSVPAGDVGGGLTGVSATFDGGMALNAPAPCTTAGGRYARLQPCPLGHTGSWTVDTSKLRDGARTVTVRAADVGGAVAEQTRSVKVDNTAPATPLAPAVEGGGDWRNVNGFALGWTNPPGQHAPISLARFEACPIAGGGCLSGERAAPGIARIEPIALPHAGEWDVRVWLGDAAGNADPTLASPAQRLRFDPDPPVLRFAGRDASAPTRVVVEASDMSGLADGQIELRPFGRGDWKPIPTVRHGETLSAEIDDAAMRGVVELRARAVDRAGNATTLLGDLRSLPLRGATRLDAAIVTRVRRGGPACRPRLSLRCRGAVTVRRSAVRTGYGSLVRIGGELRSAVGQPLPHRAVTVAVVSRNGSARLADVHTDAVGRFALVMSARRSTRIELAFHGDAQMLPTGRALALRVPAPITVRASRRLVHGDGRVVFSGRLRGGALPARGKLVEIQAHFRGRWRTISALRTRSDGRWRFGYAFRSAPRPARYRLRARVPGEAGYPFAVGTSRPVRVTVLPR